MVKIRKEFNYYLSYFVEFRRMVPVNEIGAAIIDMFFNRCLSPEKIVDSINIQNEKDILSKKDVISFVGEIKKELLTPYEGGYPIIDKEQLDVPVAVELQVNTTCNLRCKHCCQSNYSKIMPLKKVEQILEILYKNKVFEVNLTGGEFFLHPHAMEIVRLCCQKYKFATIIITNAVLLSESLIKKLSKFKNNLAFLVSLEGVGKINDEVRGKGVFEKVDRAIKILKQKGFYVEISSTINNWNIDYYQDLINHSKLLNIPLNFNLFKPFKDDQKSLILSPGRYFKFIEDIFRQKKRYKLGVGLTNAAIVAELTGYKKRKTCRATLSGLSIDVEGRMIPCAFLGEIGFYNRKKLPKFNKRFLDKWKNDNIFNQFRRNNLKECQACSYIFSGDVNGRDPYGISAFLNYRKSNQSK